MFSYCIRCIYRKNFPPAAGKISYTIEASDILYQALIYVYQVLIHVYQGADTLYQALIHVYQDYIHLVQGRQAG